MEKKKRNSGRTGATSETGKATCSLNRLDHGCRSEQLIVKGENLEDYQALQKEWIDLYPVTNFAMREALEEIVRTAWMLRRAVRNESQVHRQLAETPALDWSKADHDKLNLFARYVRGAETSHNRALRALRETQKHDAYLRDREEERAVAAVRLLDREMKRIIKRHPPSSDFSENELDIVKIIKWIANKYSPFDDYLPCDDDPPIIPEEQIAKADQ